jgi:fatty-acyl-CoA synthase
VSSGSRASNTASFQLGENTIVITDDGRRVEPGSGEIGRVAVGGFQPVGYYKDPEKTAATFIEFEGKRYSCPGDYAIVEANGQLTLLGRGSVVINTGGEKVFPEEVEEVLKTHPAVYDCLVVGVDDDRWGSGDSGGPAGPGDVGLPGGPGDPLQGHARGLQAPKRLAIVDAIVRSPSGKADYRWARSAAVSALGQPSCARPGAGSRAGRAGASTS